MKKVSLAACAVIVAASATEAATNRYCGSRGAASTSYTLVQEGNTPRIVGLTSGGLLQVGDRTYLFVNSFRGQRVTNLFAVQIVDGSAQIMSHRDAKKLATQLGLKIYAHRWRSC